MVSLIIADVHNRISWIEEFLKSQTYDEVVCLGDYFDDFGDNPDIAEKTAEWLAFSLKQPKRVHLLGNHDLPYLTAEIGDNGCKLLCSGFTHLKKRAIQNWVSFNDLDKFKLIHFTQNWALSHAGIHKYHFEHPVHGITETHIKRLCENALEGARVGIVSPILMAGRARGGNYPVGGVVWLDWNWEFKPIKGLNQIVGHTQAATVRYNYMPNKKYPISTNICLDSRGKVVGKLTDGGFEEIHLKATK